MSERKQVEQVYTVHETMDPEAFAVHHPHYEITVVQTADGIDTGVSGLDAAQRIADALNGYAAAQARITELEAERDRLRALLECGAEAEGGGR